MITKNLPLNPLSVPASVNLNKPPTSPASPHFHWHANNFIANIFSKAFLSMFADFYSPLKHASIK